jgi:hypothetical protein
MTTSGWAPRRKMIRGLICFREYRDPRDLTGRKRSKCDHVLARPGDGHRQFRHVSLRHLRPLRGSRISRLRCTEPNGSLKSFQSTTIDSIAGFRATERSRELSESRGLHRHMNISRYRRIKNENVTPHTCVLPRFPISKNIDTYAVLGMDQPDSKYLNRARHCNHLSQNHKLRIIRGGMNESKV